MDRQPARRLRARQSAQPGDGQVQSVTAHSATSLGDADRDCDLDLPDFAELQGCFGRYRLPSGCEVFDLNGNGVIDRTAFDLWVPAMADPGE